MRGERRWVKYPKDPVTGRRMPDTLCELVEINPVKFMLQPHYPRWRRRIKLAITGQGGCCLARKRQMELKLPCRLNAHTYAYARTRLASANRPCDRCTVVYPRRRAR